jgi:hypothetical protein
VVGDVELAGGQGDGAGQPVGEPNHVGTGVVRGVGVQDRLAKRAFAAIGQVLHRECAENGAVFELLEGQAC